MVAWRPTAWLLLLVAIVGAVGWLGAVEWEVSWAAPAAASVLGRWTGWSVEIGRLWVTPWGRVRATELFLQPAGAGRLHIRSLEGRYDLRGLVQGTVPGQWWIREIHIDPGSWRIRRAPAVALLAEGPIVEWMHVRTTIRWDAVTVNRIRAYGPAMRFHGAGRWRQDGTMQCWVRGQMATAALRAFGLRRLRGNWEPFHYRMIGPVAQPAMQFQARFWSFTTGNRFTRPTPQRAKRSIQGVGFSPGRPKGGQGVRGTRV